MRLVAALFVLTLLSGCLVDPDDGPTPSEVALDVEEAALPLLSQHHGDDSTDAFHYDAELHRGTMNLERVGYHNGYDNSGDANAIPQDVYYTELALHDGYVFLARGTFDPQPNEEVVGGFVIIDVNQPEDPRWVGEFNALLGSDIEVDSDGRTAFFSTQRNTIEEIVGTGRTSEEPDDAAPRGIYIVDVTDKHDPELINFVPFPYNGPHTIEYHRAGDREFLFVQTYDFHANTIPTPAAGPVAGPLGALGVNPATQRVSVMEIVRDSSGNDAGITLAQVAHFQVQGDSDELTFPHDVAVAVHPMRGDTYLYVSYWDQGVRIVDVSELPSSSGADQDSTPLLDEVGFFDRFDPSSRDNIHYAKPMETLVDGRYILVTEPEIITADETGYITFIDASTPARPEKPCPTSWWTLPGDLVVNVLEFSPHNFDTFDGKVVLAHNHAGLWVIDASTAETLCEPKSVAFTMDVEQRTDSPRWQPYFWGAIEENGLIYASDESSGLYIYEYTGP